ncbi:hypothetical protein BDF20DRAFT_908514 [Mycotypha africana]|uniref:uncharacterized protein n=1 Tax=Mycotypha africana TaxID=64632 RepID=UPI002301BA71|nr:uncharacterized protein BDF20DRAFT_908514 [Mycotypha africana]KAI8967150.1 hypothetical protein BDF20DRAFT_908514 [Mycotypha africana]
MPNTAPNSPLNATIINIHSPSEDTMHSNDRLSVRRQSNSTIQQYNIKLSPKAEEYRKMIHHIVGKLYRRKRPPSSLVYLSSLCRGEKTEEQFDNDDTIDLLFQLRSALFKTTEFDIVLSVLSDILLNDSRFKTPNPRPSRPSYSMQSVLVDIGNLLIQIGHDSSTLYHVGTEFLPAFETFSEGQMLGKLLAMYLDNLLPKLMYLKDNPSSYTSNRQDHQEVDRQEEAQKKPKAEHNTPTINIHNSQTDEVKSISSKMAHLTIDTRPNIVNAASPLSPYSPGGHSSVSSLQYFRLDSHHAYALFTPLLAFMIENLDPYLALKSDTHGLKDDFSKHSYTHYTHSIYNFHRAISYLTICKPDFYIDLLDIIAQGTSEMRFRACQILFHYYPISLGHAVVADTVPFLSVQEEIVILDKHYQDQEFEEQQQHHYQQQQQHTNEHTWYPHMFDTITAPEKQSSETADTHRLNKASLNTDPTFVYNNMSEPFCKECFKRMEGFGFRCHQCHANVHYHCYNDTVLIDLSDQNIMSYIKAGGIQKVVTPLFSRIPVSLRSKNRLFDHGARHGSVKTNSVEVALLGHLFQLVNTSTLLLCAGCSLPLWGLCHQAYRCSECNRFVHPHCLAYAEETGYFAKNSHFQTCTPFQPLLESEIQITTAALSESLVEYYGDALLLDKLTLEKKTADEVGVLLNIFQLQESILHYGVAAGCLSIVNASEKDPLISSATTEQYLQEGGCSSSGDACHGEISFCPVLADAIQRCKDYLKSGQCQPSVFYKDFTGTEDAEDGYFLNRENYLSHLTSLMKCLTDASHPANSQASTGGTSPRAAAAADKPSLSSGDARGFLQVTMPPLGGGSPSGGPSMWDMDDDQGDENQAPNESLERSMLFSWMMTVLGFKSEKATEILLQHMRNLGTLERFDGSPMLFQPARLENTAALSEDMETVQCIFPVPYAVDDSPQFEAVLSSISACLQDFDLSMNECGLLLLVRRCWPSASMSPVLQERLMHTIVSWIFIEDTQLLMLHAEYTSTMKHHSVSRGKNDNRWTQAAVFSKLRGGVLHGATAADRYKRQSNLHPTAGISSGFSSLYVTTRAALRDRYVMQWMAAIHDMDKHFYSETLFTIVDNIVDNELEDATLFNEENSADVIKEKTPVDIRSLAKFCAYKALIQKVSPKSNSSLADVANPIDIIMVQFEKSDSLSIVRGIRWLSLLTHSGTGIPSKHLAHMARLMVAAQSPLDLIAEFVKMMWFQVVNLMNVVTPRSTVIDVVSYLNETALMTVKESNENQNLSDESLLTAQKFVKYSAALTCYAFGCPLKHVFDMGIVPLVVNQSGNTM